MLAVPIRISERSACAVVVGSFQRCGEWHAPALDRARLLAGAIGSALHRTRQDAAVRATVADRAESSIFAISSRTTTFGVR